MKDSKRDSEFLQSTMNGNLMNVPTGTHSLTTRNGDNFLGMKVRAHLRSGGYAPLMRLDCQVVDGIVELSGTVPTFFMKQMAQSIVLRIGNVKGVRNEVVVE